MADNNQKTSVLPVIPVFYVISFHFQRLSESKRARLRERKFAPAWRPSAHPVRRGHPTTSTESQFVLSIRRLVFLDQHHVAGRNLSRGYEVRKGDDQAPLDGPFEWAGAVSTVKPLMS